MLCGSPNDTPPDALSLRKLPPKKPPRKPLMDFKKREKPKKKAKHPPKEKKEEKAPTPVKVEQQIIRIEVPAPPKPKPHSAVIETQTDEMTPPKVKKRRATPPPVDLPSPPPSVEQLEEIIEAEATPPVERTLSSFLSSLSPEQLKLLLKRLRAWSGQNAATSTTELSGDKEEIKERTLSSFVLSLTPEELTQLLDRLRERGQDAATSIAGLVSDTEMVKDRTLSSFLLSLSPEQLRELLKRLREGAWRRQDAATSITGLDHGATANRGLASFLLSLSPEQLKELLKRLRGDVEERQDAATSISGLISQGDLAAKDRTLSSFLLSLSTEQLRELLKRLQEDAWRRQDTATSITELLSHGDMNYQKSDRDIDIASFLLSLPLEKLRELVKRLRQDVEEDEEAATPISRMFSPGDTSDEERFKDRRLSRFLSSLSPEQLRELLARLREAGGRMSSLLFSVTEEQLNDMLAYLQKRFEDGHGDINDEEANKYRIFSSILSSLSAEQQKELLSHLREADIDIPSLISSLTGDQLKAILQYLLETIRDGHSNIVDEDSEKYRRLSRFLSSLSSEQQRELLARLQEANIHISSLMSSLTLDQLRKILKYFREMFGDGLWNIEYEESKKDRRLSRFLSSLSPEQQRDLLARLREADGRMSSLLFSLTSEQLKEMLGYLQTSFGEGYGDINDDEAEKHLVFSSFLSSLSEEQQRELRIHLGKANIDIPSLLSALTIDQLKKMMKELQEFFGHGNGDAGGRTDRRFSTFLSSLSPEQQRELLGSLREADGDISSLIFSLTPQKLKEILEYFKETFEDGHGDIDDEKAKKFRMLSSFLSSLSPDQRRQLLAQLRQANVDILSLISLLAAEQLEEVIEYLRGYYFEDESQDGSESGQSSPLLSLLSLDQQEGGLGYPQGAAGEGQSRVTTSGRETPSLFTPLSVDQISDLREFLQELFSVDHHAVPPNSKLSSLYYDSGMKSSEPQTPKSGTSFLFNDSDIGRKDESTSTSRVTFLVDEIERRSKEVTASFSELPISQDNSVMRGQAESSTAEQTPLFNDEKIIQAAASTSTRSFLPRESSTTNQKGKLMVTHNEMKNYKSLPYRFFVNIPCSKILEKCHYGKD